ncbi:MAG: TatD family deoxyribonuclease [Candidatus Methanomethylicota archaeon]|mgnify:CR=1 FL=1|uniref:TatD family deoxyribonuclease n=1 Tax=Thermoproteota archaeon TaxID=2056631 RepID=A0A497EQN4_9CREN|nr:MAG: TatD family deoxyribonuclease [Candidatus Verstraetearchaeota archaeon]
MKIYDAHCHLHEFSLDEVEKFKDYVIVAVSDDYESSLKTLELAEKFSNVIPCVGVHPWQVGSSDATVLEEFKLLLRDRDDIRCLGEIGLDKRFYVESYGKQLEFFKFFLNMAREYDLVVNAHALDAWKEVFDLLLKYEVNIALLHWYTGPLDLLEEIEEAGFYVTVNPSISIQPKHLEAVVEADVKCLLSESDGPYVYRGRRLSPDMIADAIRLLAEHKAISVEELALSIEANFYKAFGKALRRS